MAVFLLNNCKFQGCGLAFQTLWDLIQHIEDNHIDRDPQALERQEVQQPATLALSYILRFFTDAAKKEQSEVQRKRARAMPSAIPPRIATPTGSEFDDEEEEMGSGEEDSDDSWTIQEEFTSELILSMVNNVKEGEGDKPFVCPVPGCKKRYKNVNGIKYHARNGHRKDTRIQKAYKCKCGKSYKSAQGLRNHSVTHHTTTEFLTLKATPLPVVTAMQFHQTKPLAVSTSSPVGQVSPLTSNTMTLQAPVFTIPVSSAPSLLVAASNTNPITMTTDKISSVQKQISVATPSMHLLAHPVTSVLPASGM
ncbi:hypothetical protein ACJMK2_021919 [Sinanodonta woodiana]|uniref:C2H2-type domain-containing protein n=1 Tax=Sinanodonta woodiana TaxID=1069815 RepID=A0ABD3TI65_SINWO